MNISKRRSLVIVLFSVIALTLFSLGTAGAQTDAPQPTPAPGIEQAAPVPGAAQPAAPAEADDGRTLVSGKPLKGTISPANEQDSYFFLGVAGQTVTLSMNRLTGNLDGFMDLYYPRYDMWLIGNDDSGGNMNPLISNYTLPYSGRYKVLLTSFSGSSTGTYNVLLTINGVDADDNRQLVPAKVLSGKILPNNDVDNYFVWGLTGQKITLSMMKRLSNIDSYLELYDLEGNLIASDDDSGNGVDALISSVLLNTDGYYRVVARSFSNSSGGGYKIRVTLTQPNLALNKYSTAWNWHEPWYLPQYGNDGNNNTRWAGNDGTNWWWVDLGARKTFSQVKINWEAAYAANYFVGWSDAPDCLGTYTGFHYTANSAGVKTHNLSSRTARCVAVRMDVPVYWAANYSFWEFEVYNVVSNNSPQAADPTSFVVEVAPAADFSDANLVQFEMTR